jgi:hypothetical protein
VIQNMRIRCGNSWKKLPGGKLIKKFTRFYFLHTSCSRMLVGNSNTLDLYFPHQMEVRKTKFLYDFYYNFPSLLFLVVSPFYRGSYAHA